MSEERQVPVFMSAEEYANAPTYARDLIDKLALVMEQRDELARQLGIEPEWTENDA